MVLPEPDYSLAASGREPPACSLVRGLLRPAPMSLRTFVALAGAAAGLMYLFDPDTGARRRALMRAQWRGLARRAGEALRAARRPHTDEPTLRALATFGGALFAVWGLRQLDDLLEGLGALAQR